MFHFLFNLLFHFLFNLLFHFFVPFLCLIFCFIFYLIFCFIFYLICCFIFLFHFFWFIFWLIFWFLFCFIFYLIFCFIFLWWGDITQLGPIFCSQINMVKNCFPYLFIFLCPNCSESCQLLTSPSAKLNQFCHIWCAEIKYYFLQKKIENIPTK